jgi:hypothetical protein
VSISGSHHCSIRKKNGQEAGEPLLDLRTPQAGHVAVASVDLADQSRFSQDAKMVCSGRFGYGQPEGGAVTFGAIGFGSESDNHLAPERVGQGGQHLAKLDFVGEGVPEFIRHRMISLTMVQGST